MRQIGNGAVDAFIHVMEQYLTYPVNSPVQDRFAEGILKTLIEEGPKALINPRDYNVRANLMWCATMALNGVISTGVPQDWATHMIGHELTALYGLDHAQTLAIILPSMLRIRKDAKREKLLQFAERVWNLRDGSDDARIDAGIKQTQNFFEQMGVKTHLSDYTLCVETAMDRLRGAMGNSTTAQQLAAMGVIGSGVGMYQTGDFGKGAAYGLAAMALKGGKIKADQRVMKRIAEILMSGDPNELKQAVRLATKTPTGMNAIKSLEAQIMKLAPAAAVGSTTQTEKP